MPQTAIQVEHLSKRYRLGATKAIGRTFGEMVYQRLGRLTGSPDAQADGPSRTFWALRDLSFEVNRGEVIGVIGRNGAGKSTLLKILSRITDPTEGRAMLHGRLSSLLEVGTGFHPELTGRENIYLSGAVQGMRRREIGGKFDRIVAFSGVEKFLDTPVKRYSSGMYVRLAFAVAAHLEPEILLVDEVLAVGDAEFQRKCLGKMRDVAGGGRTVLFVSHNMSAVRGLTQRCLYLDHGRIAAYDSTGAAIERYMADNRELRASRGGSLDAFRGGGRPDAPVRITGLGANDRTEDVATIDIGQPIALTIALTACRPISKANVTVIVKDHAGTPITSVLSHDADFAPSAAAGRTVRLRCELPDLCLRPGDYLVDVGINRLPGQKVWDSILDYPVLHVANRGPLRLAHRPDRAGAVLCPTAKWRPLDALRGAA